MSSPHIVYAPRPGAAPEAERSALSAVYSFILDCRAKKRGRLPDKSGPNDGTEFKEDSANEHRST